MSGFPTLLWLDNGEFQKYEGGRTTESVVSFVLQQMHPAAQLLNTQEELNTFMESKGKGFFYVTDNGKDRDYKRYLDSAQQYNFDVFAHVIN